MKYQNQPRNKEKKSMWIGRRTTRNPQNRGVNNGDEPQANEFIIDRISFVLFIVVFIYLTFVISNFSQSPNPDLQELAFNSQIVLSLAIVGLIFLLLIGFVESKRAKVTLRIEEFSVRNFLPVLTWFAIGFLGISVTNFIIFQSLSIPRFSLVGFDLIFFSIFIAIAEEILFSFLIQLTFQFIFNSWIVGVIARSIVFGIYHYAVYGEEFLFLLSAIIMGLILAISLHFSKRVTTNMFIHAFNNGLSSALMFMV